MKVERIQQSTPPLYGPRRPTEAAGVYETETVDAVVFNPDEQRREEKHEAPTDKEEEEKQESAALAQAIEVIKSAEDQKAEEQLQLTAAEKAKKAVLDIVA